MELVGHFLSSLKISQSQSIHMVSQSTWLVSLFGFSLISQKISVLTNKPKKGIIHHAIIGSNSDHKIERILIYFQSNNKQEQQSCMRPMHFI